jgi:hypothetical protein
MDWQTELIGEVVIGFAIYLIIAVAIGWFLQRM